MSTNPGHAAMRSRRSWVSRVFVVLAGFLLVGAGAAMAYFAISVTDPSGNDAVAQATSLSAPTGATAAEAAATSAKISWTNPGTQVSGAQYEVIRNPGVGQVVVCTVSVPTSICTDSGLSAATSYSYSVMAVLDNWMSSAATTSFTTMAVSVTYPVNNTTYGANWTGTLTGTASAATGTTISASGVKVSVQQGSGSSSCWTGSGNTYTATCPNYVAATYSSGSWTLGLLAGDLTSGDTYHLTAQATDSLSVSTTSTTVSFTYTVSPPIASAPGATATVNYGTIPYWVDRENVTLTDSPNANGGPPVSSVSYYYCQVAAAPCNSGNWLPLGTTTSGGTWSVTWLGAMLPSDGLYDVVATATNTASLTSAVSTATEVGVDTTPPTVSTPSVNGVS